MVVIGEGFGLGLGFGLGPGFGFAPGGGSGDAYSMNDVGGRWLIRAP